MILRRLAPFLLAGLLLPEAVDSGPFHARGSFYAGAGGTWSADEGNELFDDGLHGDGAPDDSVHATFVVPDQLPGFHEFKIARPDWSELYPHHPSFVASNAVLYTVSPGEVVHFRLDLGARAGWQPLVGAVACSHFAPTGTEFELIGSAPELGSWNTGVPATLEGGVWKATVAITAPGDHAFKFRAVGTWDVCNLGVHYNMFIGENFVFSTTEAGTTVRFEFDTTDGRGRAVVVDTSPTARTSWGRLKALYR